MTQELEARLLPCPFCGGSNVSTAWTRCTDEIQWHSVKCHDCKFDCMHRDTERQAIAAWNTRTTDAMHAIVRRWRSLLQSVCSTLPILPLSPSTQRTQPMTDTQIYDMSIHSNPDATAWAKFFCEKNPNCGLDESVMVGWFANAMMTMHDHITGQGVAVLPDGSAFFVGSVGSD
jgi:Lar family restriction alleviation protein